VADALITLFAFAVGSIPFGLIVGRLFFSTDIRAQGSGNIGAMNALRSLGTRGAIAVLLLDVAKGALPVLLAARLGRGDAVQAIAALAAVLGHCFSPWLGFNGGKGVATMLGATLALSPAAVAVAVAGWLLGALVLTPYSSVGSMLAGVLIVPSLWFFTRSSWETLYGAAVALLIIYRHGENIERLRAGNENPIPFLKGRGAPKQ